MPITIQSWSAWAPGIKTPEDWQAWSKLLSPITKQEKIEALTIPAAIKRRSNHLPRMMIESSNLCLKDNNINYAIFCSEHGDLNCAMKLMKEIAAQEALSPMQFVQSVHNSASGLFSIIHKLHHNMTSIAAGEKSFFMAMIEAIAWIKNNPNDKVLLTMSDDTIPIEYEQLPSIQATPPYTASFILNKTNENEPGFSLSMNQSTQQQTKSSIPAALEFLAWWLNPLSTELVQPTSTTQFIWQSNQ